MKKYLIKHGLEFIVIVLGISISFYIEKKNLINYNEKLKNISLEKIYKNLNQDLIDLEFNYTVHKDAAYSGQQIIEHGKYLFEKEKDSLGYHLALITSGSTFFLDNKEEYTAMKNSGLIELIENQSLVSLLQSRYAETKVFSIFDDLFMQVYFDLKKFTFKNIDTQRKPFKKNYGPSTYGNYIGNSPINVETMNYIIEKTQFHQFYTSIMQARIEQDKQILLLIKKELGLQTIEVEKNSFYEEAQDLNESN